MKEKMTNEQLIREELRKEAQQVKKNYDDAENIFNNTSTIAMKSTVTENPKVSANSRLNYYEKEFRNFYPRAKEILSSVAINHK